MIKNIYYILENIKKLNDGKIKKYHIFYQLELEVLCDYLKKIIFYTELKLNVINHIKNIFCMMNII